MKKSLTNKKSAKQQALDFISTGIACNCIVYLREVGLFDFLLKGNSVDLEKISESNSYSNFPAIYSALTTLEKTGIVKRSYDKLFLTDLGQCLGEYSGLISLLFDGYGQLMAKQTNIAHDQIKMPSELIHIDSIIESSIDFGKNTVDPLINELFERIQTNGTICDLGCGLGTRLAWLCQTLGNPGLGFEGDKNAVKIASQVYKEERLISFEKADITRLLGVWEDVTVLMQYFVFHDFVKTSECTSILNSYIDNFPNLKCFIYVDIVSPSKEKTSMMPGYDYVHGLLGILTPTYEDTMKMFKDSNFTVVDELPVPDLPNTFAWILCPNKDL